MLDPDISAADSLRLLSVADDAPAGLNRRRFLQLVGMGVGGGVALRGVESVWGRGLAGALREAWAAPPVGPNEGIVVLVGMLGGNDGLNTLVPYGDGHYYDQRPGVAIPPEQVLAIDGAVGLHPRLGFLKSLYDQGQVAIVQGVGYPNADLSHFNSMANWMSAQPGTSNPTSGWVGRWLDGVGGSADLFRASTVGASVPLHMVGVTRQASAIPEHGFTFGAAADVHDTRMFDALTQMSAGTGGRGPWHDAMATMLANQLEVGRQIGPLFTDDLPTGTIARKLAIAARLINADLGMRVIDTSFGSFDDHAGEPSNHAALLGSLDDALRTFFATLDPRFRSRVTVMTYSEFGRTSFGNDSQGTDHGSASCHLVIGSGVRGGLFGAAPNLAGLQRWDRLGHTVDLRSMYASVIDGWLGGGSSAVLGGTFEDLRLFSYAPGTAPGAPAFVASGGGFVPLVPFRVLDTRSGIGAPPGAVGAGGGVSVGILGRGGVPNAGVVSVVLNLTATDATEPSYLTAWPTGRPMPYVANVHVPVGRAVPNCVIAEVGSGGSVDIANTFGATHCIADVVGYFAQGMPGRIEPVTPDRVLDTRNGIGAPVSRIGAGQTIDVVVGGRGDVPADAQAAILNVTVTSPSSAGFATVWPSFVTQPDTSVLNFDRGRTVANLCFAKLGKEGKVALFNSHGDSDYVIDVLGYTSSSASARLVPIPASKLTDTRPGNGGDGPLGPGSTMPVQVLGRGAIPDTATGVLLNVVVAEASADSYLTVWPSGEARPTSSNINPEAGVTSSNLVLMKLGADGAVDVYNDAGSLHVIVDAVGYLVA